MCTKEEFLVLAHFFLKGEGKVYVWEMSSRTCVHCFSDEGCIHGTSIAVSPDMRYLACGSDSGVVNLYAGDLCLSGSSGSGSCLKPIKALMNLTTPVDSLCINSTRYCGTCVYIRGLGEGWR